MKRLAAFLMTVTLFFGSAGTSKALEVTASGEWVFGFGWADNTAFTNGKVGGNDDIFQGLQNLRTLVKFKSSDSLYAILQTEIGDTGWGSTNKEGDFAGGGLDADGYIIKVKNAYLNWEPTDKLKIRMGVQGVALPSATFGNPVLDADVAGVLANYTINENIGVTAFWLRPFDQYTNDDDGNKNDEMDIFGVTVPMSGEGFSVTPWAMYGRNGNESGYWPFRADYTSAGDALPEDASFGQGTGNIWWVGGAFELGMFDPFALKLDAMYGSVKGGGGPEFSGWLVAGLFEYKSEKSWGNPGLLGWYASGDNGNGHNNSKFGRMPVLSNDNGGFAPLNFGFPGACEGFADAILTRTGVGTWGAGLQLDGFSFADKLSHTARIAYIRGTNSEDMVKYGSQERYGTPYNIMDDEVYMTKKDFAIEADLISTYEVNENLSIYLETALIHLNLDPGVWGANSNTTNAWKSQLVFEYTF